MFAAMKLLAFSDLHVDLEQADRLAGRAAEADVVIGAGDFASVHEGLEDAIGRLSAIETPTLLVPGNNETADALREACSDWSAATVLHGEGADVDGTPFYGLGAGIPVTPWDWSFDLDEDEAAVKLEGCPEGAVLILHSPPLGHCDVSGSGDHLGSRAILEAIEAHSPRLAVCGHIHEAWGAESAIGDTKVINLGPEGRLIEV
jgi:Icc-related predicted phosphoesterase